MKIDVTFPRIPNKEMINCRTPSRRKLRRLRVASSLDVASGQISMESLMLDEFVMFNLESSHIFRSDIEGGNPAIHSQVKSQIW